MMMIYHWHALSMNQNETLVQLLLNELRRYAIEHDLPFLMHSNEVDFMGLPARAANAVAKFHELIEGFTKMQEFLSVTEFVEASA